MARDSMALQLTLNNETKPEGVQVLSEKSKWRSPPGGWLPVQEGVWIQQPAGLYLMDMANRQQICICRGCNFLLGKLGDSGKSDYPSLGDVGNWKIESTYP
jgi:hypothetical protein